MASSRSSKTFPQVSGEPFLLKGLDDKLAAAEQVNGSAHEFNRPS